MEAPNQMTLLKPRTPVNKSESVIIHHGDVSLVLTERDAKLIHADPPWTYTNTGTADRGFNGCVSSQYDLLTMAQIIAHIDASFDSAAPDAYLFCWATWPLLSEFLPLMFQTRWRYLTGGSWHKTGGLGVGFHVRGDSEPWFLFGKGKPKPTGTLTNAWASPRTNHSEKPVAWLAKMIEAMTEPGDLVLSLYSGLCPEARAAKATGRRLVGAEIDGDRWSQAVARLNAYKGGE